ncbi:Ankyrin repeat and Tetratricopeptide-like helical domain and Ankyrin repeat-containing domain and P-loop containing nucleoside triphosphate hydrolase domain-containing protein [Strongyloides ratti]|uniref:Ankyrin repeat and Tetratricopeptide-like helical domain and Ankyrin repeat-containing domain and P-loop containing nucleoside triphosphate hydrolase domain-containing protein n=1 Tax=Strongyloides ratti TaxID=34506 RepID=A0A090L6K9_STRRB|nr:Ankyrin repeat and Tetratricopeptide-like helical domain and Ankyrin repeat-containing domain and P-loop containing nucleoside triphosphate hydrolase domain-containing protein [Strongyloides ratti]CEF65382.1 Ankyrin repeat and Tetratricopeptide-like helical domain and Ankyrin repeat-containing domain and P-loop containing nucleoside triphosphate hydrolase domain-containing protein [Strongyloides ratti]
MMYIPQDRLSCRRDSGSNDYNTVDHTNQGNSFNNFGSLRRSLRQMNPFKSKLFRLPATPRLSRKNKDSSGVETTGWNFERPSSVTSLRESISNLDNNISSQNLSTNNYHNSPSLMIRKTNGEHIKIESFRKSSVDSSFDTKSTTSSTLRSSSFRVGRGSISSTIPKDNNPNGLLPPSGNIQTSTHITTTTNNNNNNNNNRLSYIDSLRKGQINDETEKQKILIEGTRGLQLSPPIDKRNSCYQRLPNNQYSSNGEVYDAHWRTNSLTPQLDVIPHQGMSFSAQIPSPCNSTISLLGTASKSSIKNGNFGSSSVRSAKEVPFQRASVLGFFNRSEEGTQSARNSFRGPTSPTNFNNSFEVKSYQTSTNSLLKSELSFNNENNSYRSPLNITQLFTLEDFTVPCEIDTVFVGREWLFKELYRMSVIEKTQFCVIEGANGSGKSAIIKHIILHSPFFLKKTINGDTVDSGIVLESNESSLTCINLSSKYYEWLRQISNRVVAYHNCRLYSASSCAIPEFICNLVAQFVQCSKFYPLTEFLSKPENSNYLTAVSNPMECCKYDPVELFKKAIGEILCNMHDLTKDEPSNCCIILIDSLDEADFHRLEDGESISWFLSQIRSSIPSWLRFILTSSNQDVIHALNIRSVHIDDSEMDERILRDCRLLIENSLSSYSDCEEYEGFVDKVLHFSQGNMLFIHMIIDLVDRELIKVSSHVPNDISQLYLIYFKNIFKSEETFEAVSPILAVIIASLRPLKFNELLQILNSRNEEPYMTEDNLTALLSLMIPLLSRLQNGSVIISHQTFREWIIKCANQANYIVDVRQGHILHAMSYVRNYDKLSIDQIFELAHHLLKANPYKYMKNGIGDDLPKGKDCQLVWLQMAGQSLIKTSLLYHKNIIYPNSKVSRLLLLAGADANVCWSDSQEPILFGYARTNNVAMIQLLLQFGAEVDYRCPNTGSTALMEAAKKGNIEATKVLLKFGAIFYNQDEEGLCALSHAAAGGHINLVIFLLEESDKINHQNSINQGNFNAPIAYLQSSSINKAFESAASFGKVQICKYLLDFTDAITDMSTAMCSACTSGQSETVQFLLSRGAYLSMNQYWNGKSALICAIESGSWDLVVNVLSTGNIDVNTDRCENAYTPLIVASRKGHVGLVDLLINHGAILDIPDNTGKTAVIHSIICKHASTAALLIDRGEYSSKCLIDKLLDLGLSLEEKNNDGLRPIEVAIKYKNRLAMDGFLRKGARLRATTWKLAIEIDPEMTLILIRKLLDDASFLLRKKLINDAMHRFHYALARCNELLEIFESSNLSNNERKNFSKIIPQLKHFKLQILFATARLNRKNGELMEAIENCSDALTLAQDNDDHRCELYLLRAKCFFDAQNVSRARRDAEIANGIKPGNIDVQTLLNILCMPTGDRS